MFDPWTATLDQALAAQREWDERGAGLEPTAPIFQWDAARRVDGKRAETEGTDGGFAVLACVRSCVTAGLAAPEWLAYAFNRRYDQVLNCRVGSWDSAFGKPYRGKHLDKLRRRRKLVLAIPIRVAEVLRAEPSTPIDEALFERVGSEFKVGKTLAAEIYYASRRMTSAK